MRGFLECYGFRPDPKYIPTCDELMEDEEDALNHLNHEVAYLDALDEEDYRIYCGIGPDRNPLTMDDAEFEEWFNED